MIRWHVQHDDEVWAGDLCLGAANNEEEAKMIVAFQNKAAMLLKPQPGHGDLQIAFDALTSFLLDQTEEVFEEEPEIDAARQAIIDKMEEIERGQASLDSLEFSNE